MPKRTLTLPFPVPKLLCPITPAVLQFPNKMVDLGRLKEDRENLKYILRNDSLDENARAIYTWLLADVEQKIRDAEKLPE
jgi:hypothetical protein